MMRNKLITGLVIFSAAAFTSCENDDAIVPAASTDHSYVQEFDSISAALTQGWVTVNNTKPKGVETWNQAYPYYESKKGLGNVTFDAQSFKGSGTDFLMITSDCGSGVANVSAWLISPKTIIKNGDEIIFHTRTYINPAPAADRLQVRLNAIDGSAEVGSDSSSLGNFTTLLSSVNPNLLLSGAGSYPGVWTRYSVIVSGLPAPLERRFAFRYNVPNGGPLGANGLGIGIDSVAFVSH